MVDYRNLALGDEIEVPTVYGDVKLKIPEGTQANTKFRLKEKGVKDLRSGRLGDQFVEVKLVVDKKLNKETKKLYEAIRENKSDDVYESFKKSFRK